jgi:cyclohexa-1,5-dienecarbonyl-CoA hydratase
MKLAKATLDYQHDGQIATVRLAAPKANILDQAMMANLSEIFEAIACRSDLKAIVVTADGPNFSYGASVQEHLPDQISGTLKQLRELLELAIGAPAPTIAAVRGQCLGGGFELVLTCDLILAEETAQFGCPEIKLGVFPPAASALLPVKVGNARAANLVLRGDSWTGTAASEAGLVSFLTGAGGLDQKLNEVLEADFLPRSAAALRYAVRAVRLQSVAAIKDVLPQLERMYLSELMKEPNALEGLRSFLEKRQPAWARSKPVN